MFIMRLLEPVYMPFNVVIVIFKVLVPCKLELIYSVVLHGLRLSLTTDERLIRNFFYQSQCLYAW
jgi:hypothetical protein